MSKNQGGVKAAMWKYHGREISVAEAAEIAGVTEQTIRNRLKANNGNMEAAIDGVKPSEIDAATDEIMDIIGMKRSEPEPPSYPEPSMPVARPAHDFDELGPKLADTEDAEQPTVKKKMGAKAFICAEIKRQTAEAREELRRELEQARRPDAQQETTATVATVPQLSDEEKQDLRRLNAAIFALAEVQSIEVDDDTICLIDDTEQRLRRIRRELFDEHINWEEMAR